MKAQCERCGGTEFRRYDEQDSVRPEKIEDPATAPLQVCCACGWCLMCDTPVEQEVQEQVSRPLIES